MEGKYTVVFCETTGKLKALRYGQSWRDLTGDALVLAMLQEVDGLRSQRLTHDQSYNQSHDQSAVGPAAETTDRAAVGIHDGAQAVSQASSVLSQSLRSLLERTRQSWGLGRADARTSSPDPLGRQGNKGLVHGLHIDEISPKGINERLGQETAKLRAVEDQATVTSGLLAQARQAIEALKQKNQLVRRALSLASDINPYGDVKNYHARQAATQALEALREISPEQASESSQVELQGELFQREASSETSNPSPGSAGDPWVGGLPFKTHNLAQMAWELERTAMGDGFYGNALRSAKDVPGMDAQDRSLLDRYATGRQSGTDHIKLQALALRLDEMARREDIARSEEAAAFDTDADPDTDTNTALRPKERS